MGNYYERFRESAVRFPQNVAIELQRQNGTLERLSYAELQQHAEAIAAWLARAELAAGARCAILAGNGPRWVAAYLGVIAAGHVAVPLDTAFKPEQITKLLKDCGASLLFADARHLPAAEAAIGGTSVRIVQLDTALPPGSAEQRMQALRPVGTSEHPLFDDIVRAAHDPITVAQRTPDDTAVILYTSGTTSDPKGVMLTHQNLLAESQAVFGFVAIGPKDALLGVLPLFHALAQMANLLLPLAAGARVVFLEALNTSELMRALGERDITLFACVPQFFYLIHERIGHKVEQRGAGAKIVFDWLKGLSAFARRLGLNPGRGLFREAHKALGPRMRYLVTGGSRFDPVIARDLHAMGFDILQAYGLTETSGGACATPPGKNVLGSVGPPLPGNEVRIVDPQPQPEGPPVGEVALRGGIIMKGYYNRPEATAEVLRDGWLYTGDLGYVDPRGNLFITGRKKDVIVLSNGKNIYPEEIESHYQRSPFIKELCVMGLRNRPGEPFSERLHAVIVPDFEALRARKIVNAGEVIRFDIESLSSQMPSTKRILSYDIWQHELPRTTTRKLKRFVIQKEVEQRRVSGTTSDEAAVPARQLTEADIAWLEEPDSARALPAIRAAAKIKKPQYHPDDSLELDLGLDSMERVELLVAVEEALGAHVEDSVVSEVYTIRELVEAVKGGKGAAKDAAGWESVLAVAPPPEDVHEFERARTFSAPLWYALGRVANLFVRIFFRLEVSGLENLPREGAYLICPNHQSFMDPPVVGCVLPWHVFRRLFTVGTSEIFGAGFFRSLARSLRLFPVDPDANLVPAMRIGAFGLRRGMVLMLYPEGERSIDGAPKRFKKGAGILATHLRVPIVPVAMEGFFDAWPRGKSFQTFAKLKLRFGKPVPPPEITTTPEAAYDAMMQEVRARIVTMWEELRNGKARGAAAG